MMRPGILLLGLPLLASACGGKTSADTTDACATCVDDSGSEPDVIVTRPDAGPDLGPPPPIDAGPPPPADCSGPPVDPANPPIECGPAPGTPKCRESTEVATCPADTACMARAKPSGPTLDFRMGRLRFYAPDALLSLAPLAIDPNVNPKCDNAGADALNWMMRFDPKAGTLVTGGASKSTDGGVTYALTHGTIDASSLDAICPGFAGPSAPISLEPAKVSFAIGADGAYTTGRIPKLAIPIYEGSVPLVLPLSDVEFHHVKVSADGACIGSWARDFWCDGDTLGWTTGGAVVAKISVEDADHVPVKNAGCQSLCAILANDSTKTSGKLCKRSADGTIPPIGDATVSTKGDAFFLSATFGAYGVKIVP